MVQYVFSLLSRLQWNAALKASFYVPIEEDSSYQNSKDATPLLVCYSSLLLYCRPVEG